MNSNRLTPPTTHLPTHADWRSGATRTEQLVWIYGLIVFVLGIFLAIFNTPYFDNTYTLEDGLLEWLSAFALGTTSFVCVQRLILHRNAYTLQQHLIIGLTALLFLFGAGEEISWGQRLLGITSPDFFEMNNIQGETNLHNLMIGETKVNKLIFGKLLAVGFLIYLGLLTPLHRRSGNVAALLNAWAVPIPTRLQWWGYIGIILGVEGAIHVFSETPKRGELTECATSLVVMLTVLYPANRS
ncbi:MAG: hypothetical protein P8104_12530, partial [Gammaproteobacteria bacterium]